MSLKPVVRKAILEECKLGVKHAAIAAEFKVTPTTVLRIATEGGLAPRRAVRNLKRMVARQDKVYARGTT